MTQRNSQRNLALYDEWKLMTQNGKHVYKVKNIATKYKIKSRANLYRIIREEKLRDLDRQGIYLDSSGKWSVGKVEEETK